MNRERKPRFAFTDVERRTLFVLGLLLVIGIVGKQVLRYAEPDSSVVIEGSAPPAESVDTINGDGFLPGGNGSSSLATSTSDTVPSKLHVPDSRMSDRSAPDASEEDLQIGDPGTWSDVSSTPDPRYVTPRTGGSDRVDADRFDLNRVTREQLETIPGVGPVLAGRILDWRERHGSFQRMEDLLLVEGIGDKRLATLKQHVYVQPRNIAESEGKPDGGNKAL